MDEFLREIHISVLREWIWCRYQGSKQFSRQDDNIIIDTQFGIGHINFYEDNIIELNVIDKQTGEMCFFIHFQINGLHHAIGLLKEMKECLETMSAHHTTKVLLSCTSGLTTGYFAQKLQEGASLLNKDFEFEAVAYSELFSVADKYDLILLAPQVSYMQSKVQEVLKNKTVLALSSVLFGKYDVANTLAFIEEELQKNAGQQNDEGSPLPIKQPLKKHGQILCLAFIILDVKVRLVSRLYGHDDIILEDYETYKSNISFSDVSDMIDYILLKHPDIELISLSLPGVVYQGSVTLENYGLHHHNLMDYLSQKYTQKIVLSNDVNAIVMGFYASQDEYKSISFLLQTKIGGTGGVGHVHNGHLITGRHNVAGEIKYLPIAFSDNYEKIRKTPEGAIEWTAKYCVAITSMVAPEEIVIMNRLVTSVDDVKSEMKKFLPEDFIPDIIQIESLKEYMLIGSIILGLKEIDRQ